MVEMTRWVVHRGVLRELMRAQGYRDAATLAREARLAGPTVRKIITGERPTVSEDTLSALASVLDVGLSALGRPLGDVWVMGPAGPEPLARRAAREGKQR